MLPSEFDSNVVGQQVDSPRCKLTPPALGTCKDGQTLKPAHVFLDGDCKEIVHNWCKGQVNENKDNLFATKDDCIKGFWTCSH